jgi:2-octaprenyl-6-methoxyphenol hydroxylase
LNLAIRDIAALVECVADAAQVGGDLGAAAVLDRYERWRRFDSAASTAAFDSLNRLFSNDYALVRAARTVGLGAVNRLDVLKHLLVQEAAGLSGKLPKLLQSQPARAEVRHA